MWPSEHVVSKPDGRGPTSAESWLRGQVAYDLWQTENNGKKIDIRPAEFVTG